MHEQVDTNVLAKRKFKDKMNASFQIVMPLTAVRLQHLHTLVMKKIENLTSILIKDQRSIPLKV